MGNDIGSVLVNGKVLRCGYTTGSCATAASVGATEMFLSGQSVKSVNIKLPSGQCLNLKLEDCEVRDGYAKCAVIKDAGDDIDITDGLYIYSTVSKSIEPGIHLMAGEGVGTVTQEGLSVAVGEPAINPVPKRMIIEQVSEVCKAYNYDLQITGLDITISIPDGKSLAERTFNPKLGIKDGLSILGTSGIVKPMSKEALIKSIELELSVLRVKEKQFSRPIACFVPGNYGEEYAEQLGILSGIIKISNFIGTMLESALSLGFKEILLIGDLGKLVKISAGIFQTHSRISDARAEVLAANIAAIGAPQNVVQEMLDINTTVKGIQIIEENHLEDVFEIIADKVKKRCQDYVHSELTVEVILFSRDRGTLAKTAGTDKFIKNLKRMNE